MNKHYNETWSGRLFVDRLAVSYTFTSADISAGAEANFDTGEYQPSRQEVIDILLEERISDTLDYIRRGPGVISFKISDTDISLE